MLGFWVVPTTLGGVCVKIDDKIDDHRVHNLIHLQTPSNQSCSHQPLFSFIYNQNLNYARDECDPSLDPSLIHPPSANQVNNACKMIYQKRVDFASILFPDGLIYGPNSEACSKLPILTRRCLILLNTPATTRQIRSLVIAQQTLPLVAWPSVVSMRHPVRRRRHHVSKIIPILNFAND